MKNGLRNMLIRGEKHNLENLVICLLDRTGKVMWVSSDPNDELKIAGKPSLDYLVPEYRDLARTALKTCIIDCEVVGYLAEARSTKTGKLVSWRNTLIPIKDHGIYAAAVISTRLPNK